MATDTERPSFNHQTAFGNENFQMKCGFLHIQEDDWYH